jgi:hypothetical protein
MYTLADEARTLEALKTHEGIRAPARRLAFARQLGVAATSTARERLDHELTRLAARILEAHGLTVETLDPAAHAERLARADLRPTAPAAWRHGDEIHLLHAEPPGEHPRLVVHRPTPAVPALTRLLDHVSDWSMHDHEADPSLARAVEALDPEGRERPALLHARAAVLWNRLLPEPQPRPRHEHWLEELRALFAEDPPPASLRLRLPGTASDHEYLAFADDDRLTASLNSPPPVLARPRGRRTIIASRDRTVLAVSEDPACRTLEINSKSQWAVEVSESHGYSSRVQAKDSDDHHGYGRGITISPLWLPVLTPKSPDVDLWLDCMERSSILGGWAWEHSTRCDKLLRSTGKPRFQILKGGPTKVEPITIDPTAWREADLRLAECWLALRVALVRPLCLQLVGEVVCALGGGVSAVLEVRPRRSGAPVDTVAAFDASISVRAAGLDHQLLSTHVAKSSAYTADLGIRVPSRLVLLTPSVSVSITFVASPLLQATMPAALGSFAPVTAEEQSAADDED